MWQVFSWKLVKEEKKKRKKEKDQKGKKESNIAMLRKH